MKRLSVLLGVMLVLVTASPAVADDAGADSHGWGAHCSSTAIWYMHTRGTVFSDWINGRFEFVTCSGGQGAQSIDLTSLMLFRIRPGGNWTAVSSRGSGSKSVSGGGDFNPLWETPDAQCDVSGSSEVRVGDTVHVNAKYVINWKDGSHTSLRNDNSLDWTITAHNQCS